MGRLLRWLAKKCGVSTWYHIAAVYHQDSHMGTSTVSLTCRVSPWIHEDNYSDVAEFVRSKSHRAVTTPSITSITRLGP